MSTYIDPEIAKIAYESSKNKYVELLAKKSQLIADGNPSYIINILNQRIEKVKLEMESCAYYAFGTPNPYDM